MRGSQEGEQPRFTFEEAACRYMQEQQAKPSVGSEILYLKLAMPYVGGLFLDEICDEALYPMVSALKAPVVTKRSDGTAIVRVRKNKTVNLVLGTIRHVLNLAARKWRVESNLRLTWLIQAPLIRILDLHDARSRIRRSKDRITQAHIGRFNRRATCPGSIYFPESIRFMALHCPTIDASKLQCGLPRSRPLLWIRRLRLNQIPVCLRE
jgi:hypothetical protein